MVKDLVYEVYKDGRDTIKCNPLKVSDRMKSNVYQEVITSAMSLGNDVEKVISRNYPQITRARISIEFE